MSREIIVQCTAPLLDLVTVTEMVRNVLYYRNSVSCVSVSHLTLLYNFPEPVFQFISRRRTQHMIWYRAME
jgi:hypothetical protein